MMNNIMNDFLATTQSSVNPQKSQQKPILHEKEKTFTEFAEDAQEKLNNDESAAQFSNRLNAGMQFVNFR